MQSQRSILLQLRPRTDGRCENEVAAEVSSLSGASPHNHPTASHLTRTPLPDQSGHLLSFSSVDDSAPGSNIPIPALDEPLVVLPSFTSVAEPTFSWGQVDADSFSHSLDASYAEIVHWRKNCFKVPAGNSGKSFVSEVARLFRAFAEKSALESVALKAVTVLAILTLQKPFRSSKTKDHVICLVRRLALWKDGNLNDLVLEGRSIQKRLPRDRQSSNNQQLARSFSNLMFAGVTGNSVARKFCRATEFPRKICRGDNFS